MKANRAAGEHTFCFLYTITAWKGPLSVMTGSHGATTRNRSFQADFPFRRLTPPCQAGGFAWSDSSTAAAASAYRPRKADKDGGPSMLRQAIIALSTQHARMRQPCRAPFGYSADVSGLVLSEP